MYKLITTLIHIHVLERSIFGLHLDYFPPSSYEVIFIRPLFDLHRRLMFHDFLPPTYSTYLFFGGILLGIFTLHSMLLRCLLSTKHVQIPRLIHTYAYIYHNRAISQFPCFFPILRSRFSTL